MTRSTHLRRARIYVFACVTSGVFVAPASAQQGWPNMPETWTREQITARLADLGRIHTPEGIEALEQIDVGGTKQWLSIRGLNKANPVLLVLHGGPGSPLMAASWAFQKPWEDFFTVVEWDQRGGGKNFLHADTAALGATLSNERLTRDAEDVTAYLRRRLGKDKIVLLGYSWGTILGTRLIKRHPDWFYAYVGVGQAAPDGETYLYAALVKEATARHDTAALLELREIAPYPDPSNPQRLDVRKALIARKYARRYDGGWYGKPDFDLYFFLSQWGSEYTRQEAAVQGEAISWVERHVVEDSDAMPPANAREHFQVPVILMMGRYDLHTPYEAAKAWFERIEAPKKRLITFERSAHMIMFEEPGRFLVTLVNDVLPLTGEHATFQRLR